MAKAPVTRDRFKISAEIAAEDLGLILLQLARMGLENVEYEIITDVRTFHQNPDRKVHEVKAETFAVETFLPHHSRFKASDLTNHFKAHGRTASAVYYALATMTKNGTLRKADDGWYEVAPKQLPPPATADMFNGDKPEEPVKKWDRSGKAEILGFSMSHDSFTTKQLRELFRAQGRNEASVHPTLYELLEEKRIKRTGPGEYTALKSKRPAE
jgi:hypothetical protein